MDIREIRRETPGCAEVAHFNNAGAALQPAPVLDAVHGHLELEARRGGYEAAEMVLDRLERTYDSLARLIGADRDEIAYTDNATRSWDLAFHSIPFRRGDRILTTTSEYASNAISYIQAARRYGVSVEVVPDASAGQLSLEALADMLDRGRVRLVSINHMPTHDGLINPAAEVGALAHAAGALFLLDACQSVGHLAIDVDQIGCDMLSATGRKYLRGPRGTGFLYVRGDIIDELDPPFLDDQGATWTGAESFELNKGARRFEVWERSIAAQLGLGAAADYALAVGPALIERRTLALAATLRTALRRIPGVTVLDRGVTQSGIVTFLADGPDPVDDPDRIGRRIEQGASNHRHGAYHVKKRLAARDINVSVAEHTYRYDGGVAPAPRVRASTHYYNTRDEIEMLADTLTLTLRSHGRSFS